MPTERETKTMWRWSRHTSTITERKDVWTTESRVYFVAKGWNDKPETRWENQRTFYYRWFDTPDEAYNHAVEIARLRCLTMQTDLQRAEAEHNEALLARSRFHQNVKDGTG